MSCAGISYTLLPCGTCGHSSCNGVVHHALAQPNADRLGRPRPRSPLRFRATKSSRFSHMRIIILVTVGHRIVDGRGSVRRDIRLARGCQLAPHPLCGGLPLKVAWRSYLVRGAAVAVSRL